MPIPLATDGMSATEAPILPAPDAVVLGLVGAPGAEPSASPVALDEELKQATEDRLAATVAGLPGHADRLEAQVGAGHPLEQVLEWSPRGDFDAIAIAGPAARPGRRAIASVLVDPSS